MVEGDCLGKRAADLGCAELPHGLGAAEPAVSVEGLDAPVAAEARSHQPGTAAFARGAEAAVVVQAPPAQAVPAAADRILAS